MTTKRIPPTGGSSTAPVLTVPQQELINYHLDLSLLPRLSVAALEMVIRNAQQELERRKKESDFSDPDQR